MCSSRQHSCLSVFPQPVVDVSAVYQMRGGRGTLVTKGAFGTLRSHSMVVVGSGYAVTVKPMSSCCPSYDARIDSDRDVCDICVRTCECHECNQQYITCRRGHRDSPGRACCWYTSPATADQHKTHTTPGANTASTHLGSDPVVPASTPATRISHVPVVLHLHAQCDVLRAARRVDDVPR